MRVFAVVLIWTGFALAACKPHPSQPLKPLDGRYGGIGLYTPGTGWTRLADAAQPNQSGKGKLEDDDRIIVVVDSQTGEVRQCGSFSAYCISFNPWTQKLGAGQTPPLAMMPPVSADAKGPAASTPAP